MRTCVACCQRLAKEFCWLFVLLQTQFRCQHCVSIILVVLREKNSSFPLKKSTTKIAFSKRMLTYFVHRLKRHLGINFIGFRICLHKKYVSCAQLVKHTARGQNWHFPGCLEEPGRVVKKEDAAQEDKTSIDIHVR